jgi:ABC-type transporter Mla MlaB component
LENFGFRFVQWEEAYTEHPLADFEPKLIPSDLDGQTKAMPLKVVHEIDFLAICAKQARLQKLADFMEGALQLARHFDAYCSFHLSPSAPKHSIVQHKEHHAFASDSTEQILSIDENAYSSMMGMFSNSVLVQLHHLNQCRKDPAATLVLPARSLHQKLQRVRARHVEHTTGAYFQGGPLSSFQTFTAYALSLMPDGQANHINVTTHDLQVTMIRKALAELKSLLCFVVEVPRSPTGHIDGLAENISDVPVIAHMMQTTLAPHRQSLDQVVDLPTDGDLFVIGSSDLERAFNSMARDVNALSTSCRRSNMESTLGQNADTNELLYRVQKENDLLLVDIGKRGGERQVALDFDVALNLQSLLLQRSNLTFRCSELRETLRAEEVVVSMRARRHFGTMSMRMAKRLRAIKAKFEEYKEELSAHIMTASRSLKQQVVLNLQGEYSQRSLMALLEEQKTQMSRSMVQVDELEEARRQSAGLKHHLLRLQTHMSKSMRDGRSEDVRHVNKAVETLHGHSDKEHELQLLKQELERSVILSAQAEHARICATQNLHALRSKLERSTTEKRALLKCRAENNARFQELAEKGRKYDMMTSTSIRQVQEAAVGSQKEGAEEFEAAEENALSSSLYETEQEQVEREVQSQLLFTQNMESLRMQLQARQREKDGALLELARHESTHQHTPLERSPEDMSWNPGQGTHERTHPWNKALFTAHAAKYRNKVQELQRENQVLEELMGRRKQARRPELPVSRPHTTAERQIGTPMRGEQNRVSRTAHSDAEWNRSHKGISSARGVRRRQDGEVSRLLHTSPRAAFSPMASVDLDEYFARQSTIERLPRFAGVVQQPAGTGSFMESGLLSLAMAQSTPADQVRVQKRFRSTRETARVVKDSMERKIAGPYAQPQASRVARPPQKPAVAPQTSRPYINLNLEASSGAGDGRHYRSVANSNRAVVESALAIHRFENKSSIR